LVLYPSLVQGEEASRQLPQVLRLAGQRAAADGVEVLLLVRGGGSLEDLWAFNNEALALALAASPLPVVTGVGHETDFTIADFAADSRAATPTAAAELVSEGYAQAQTLLNRYQQGLHQRIEHQLNQAQQRLDYLRARLPSPLQRLQRAQLQLDKLVQQLQRHGERRLQHAQQQLQQLHAELGLLNPNAVLQRGYSIAYTAQGEIIRTPQQAPSGSPLTLQLAQGQLTVHVD
jgi:exodeoxyribonuclease VII large subunit